MIGSQMLALPTGLENPFNRPKIGLFRCLPEIVMQF